MAIMNFAETFPALSALPDPQQSIRELEEQTGCKASETIFLHGIRLSPTSVRATYFDPKAGVLFSLTIDPAKEPKKWQPRRKRRA